MPKTITADFFGADPFDFSGAPGYTPPSMKKLHTAIPEVDDLYGIQSNLLRTLQALDRLESDNPDIHWEGLQRHLDQSYKTLRNWLETHG